MPKLEARVLARYHCAAVYRCGTGLTVFLKKPTGQHVWFCGYFKYSDPNRTDLS
jgi:hypothetical protein